MTNITKKNPAQKLPLPPAKPAVIKSEGQAIEIALELATEFKQNAAKRDQERLLPWQEIERYTASGLGTITVPKAYGGLEASNETVAKVFTIICAADPSLGQIPQNHFVIIQNLKEYGSEAQKKRWFNDVLNGYRLGNAGPERKAKAKNITDFTARLIATPDGLRANGSRFYSTGAIFAHWVPFRALNDNNQSVQVWVRRDAPGVEIIDDWNSFGQKTTASGTVLLNNVLVQEEDVIPLWKFADKPDLSGPISQLIQASIDAGIARGALEDAFDFVRQRSRPWVDASVDSASADPYIIQEAGKLQIEMDAAYEVLLSGARLIDELAQKLVTEQSSALASVAIAEAKILTTEAALNISEQLFALAGSAATRMGHNLDRHWRNARVHTLHDPIRWKYHLIGNYLLNGTLPKRHQWN